MMTILLISLGIIALTVITDLMMYYLTKDLTEEERQEAYRQFNENLTKFK